MTSTALDRVHSSNWTPGRTGQATAVEQSRAVAEVEAAIVVAMRHPRDVSRAQRDMERSCAHEALAQKAFFRYSRGGQPITGPSVQLARELARCWGNVQYGLAEMRRDDDFAQSEMLAFAWDVETNARASTTFIVPHKRDKTGGPVPLTEMRDIYENNANMGARRLREMIFAILPGWYTETAVAACYETLNGDASGLPDRIEKCVAGFGQRAISQQQLERKLGAPRSAWTGGDLAQLQVIWRSLVRGETTRDEEFGTDQAAVTAADILQTPAAQDRVVSEEPLPETPAPPATTQARKPALDKLADTFARLSVEPADEPAVIAWLMGPDWTASSRQVSDLTKQLGDFLADERAQGDVEEARSLFWQAFRNATDNP